MYIKGFCAKHDLADNVPGKTAQVGELTTYARTFSKDIGIYTDISYPNLEVDIFSCRNIDGEILKPFDNHVALLLQIANTVYGNEISTTNRSDYATTLNNLYFGSIESIEVGNIITTVGGTIPESISFVISDTEPIEVKLWFSAIAMERDYDEYEIEVVHPLLNIDILFNPVAEIRAALAETNVSAQLEKVQLLKDKKPETVLRAETIKYVNPSDPTIEIDLVWYVLIYGPNGDNEDAIKNAIADAILAESSEPVEAWKEILPFLFKVTRMFVLPRWDIMSIPSRLDLVGIYSPISTVKEALTYAKATLSHLTNRHVEDNLQITHHKYRAVTLLVCGGEDNALDKFKLTDYVPDYIAESSTSQDFNRQTETTKRWTVAMEELLMLAESFTVLTALPVGVRRVTIGDVAYLTKRIDSVEWLVAIREV